MNAFLVIAYVALTIMNGFLAVSYIRKREYVAGGLHALCAVIWGAILVIRLIR